MSSISSSRLVPLGLCILLLFHGSLAQLSYQRQQSPRLSGRSDCQFQKITAREPNRLQVSEAGVSEFWDSYEGDELECAGVEVVRHTINPKGLLLPYYPNTPELVYVVRGQGLQGTVLPGCEETFETSFPMEGGREQFFDKHQKVYRYKEGDILALPAGAVHWTYNDGDTPLLVVALRDTSNVANQLDRNFKKFFLAGNPQSQMQHGEAPRRQGHSQKQPSWEQTRPGQQRPSWEKTRPGQHGQQRPSWEETRPGQQRQQRPSWEETRPGQQGQQRPSWEETRPGQQGQQRPSWEETRPGQQGQQRPSWEQTGHGQQKPSWEQTRPGQQGEQRPSWEKTRPGQQGEQRPSWEQTRHGQQGEQRPSWEQTRHGQQGEQRPSWEQTRPGQQGEQRPSWEQTRPGQQGEQRPSWEQTRPGRQGEQRPSWEQTRPGQQGEQRPSKEQTRPDQQGERPWWEKSRPGQHGQQRPSKEQTRPGQSGQERPWWEQSRPGQHEQQGPSWEQNRPSQQRPSWEETRPSQQRPSWEQSRPSQHGQQEGFNMLAGFDDEILQQVYDIEYDIMRQLKGFNDNRGLIVLAKNFQVLIPKEHEQYFSPRGNGIEQTICSTKFRSNIANPATADVFNPRGGRISTLNSHKLPVLESFQLSAERGVLYKNAVLAPHYNLNAHSIMYITGGSSRLQIVRNDGSLVFDDWVKEGQLIVVPQDFAVIKKAGEEGCDWVAFKTNDNAMTTQLAGRFSYIRALPEDVLMNSYNISREEAKNLKYSRKEGVVLSPQSGSISPIKMAENVVLKALFG